MIWRQYVHWLGSGPHYDSTQPHNSQTCFLHQLQYTSLTNLNNPGFSISQTTDLAQSSPDSHLNYTFMAEPMMVILNLEHVKHLLRLSQNFHFYFMRNIKLSLRSFLRTYLHIPKAKLFQSKP